jgi:hypothetical protein
MFAKHLKTQRTGEITLMLKRYPVHFLTVALFPILALLANNLGELPLSAALRPLLVSILAALVLWIVARWALRDSRKAALLTSTILIFFFSYGHLYQFFREIAWLNPYLGRHRYLVPVYVISFISGLWWISRKVTHTGTLTSTLNLMGLSLVLIPLIQITTFSTRVSTRNLPLDRMVFESQPLKAPEGSGLPDIYYIILDMYTRGDVLLDEYGFDNSTFINDLEGLGFIVPECSRSNYSFTQASITSALNMNYLPELETTLQKNGFNGNDTWVLLKQSLARQQLEAIGYDTVAFETGYEWSRIEDADIYLGLADDPLSMQRIDPFEALLFKSTAGLIMTDAQSLIQTPSIKNPSVLAGMNFPHSGHVERQLFILEQLPEISSLPQPTFTFVHLLTPHVPFVFAADGSIHEDSGYYGGRTSSPINEFYQKDGYIQQIQFINHEMTTIIKSILERSETLPILIIQGDHGYTDRLKILNAYYFPPEINMHLYPTITPVNSFRILFDSMFGTDYGLLSDISYEDGATIDETSPTCLLKQY